MVNSDKQVPAFRSVAGARQGYILDTSVETDNLYVSGVDLVLEACGALCLVSSNRGIHEWPPSEICL